MADRDETKKQKQKKKQQKQKQKQKQQDKPKKSEPRKGKDKKGKGKKPIDWTFAVKLEAERAGFHVRGCVDFHERLQVDGDVADESALPLLSIDNDDTQDIDQLTCARRVEAGIELHVAIADVASSVAKDSPNDKRAGGNTTTLYLHVLNCWMIPKRLCCDETSLVPGERRPAVISRFVVTPDGRLHEPKVWRGFVVNKWKLAYNAVSEWLEGRGALDVPDQVKEQLRLHVEVSKWLEKRRMQKGSLPFRTAHAQPVIEGGQPVGVAPTLPNNVAQDIIQYVMIAANHLFVKHLRSKGAPTLRRIVRTPKQWDKIVVLAKQHGFDLPAEPSVLELQRFLKTQSGAMDADAYRELSANVIRLMGRGEYTTDDAEGHFALATLHYTHSTAPNRRYPDLVNQRMLFAVLAGRPLPYTVAELEAIAQQCTEREDACNKLERKVTKMLLAQVLRGSIGMTFNAAVSGVTKDKGEVWCRVIAGDFTGVEGRLMSSGTGYRVGQQLLVRLVSVAPLQGFIDFAVEGARQ